ncbi:MAG: SIMPL domain-containing protein [Planctomycetes bacterium]|nr:SIMPL domain-containing protein [Planctomycetota bacterium]
MRISITLALFFLSANHSHAQVSGNVGYSQGGGRVRAENAERAKRLLSESEKPAGNGMFLDAGVLLNVKADEYIAVFALSQEAPTVAECSRKMEENVRAFAPALKKLGFAESDVSLDFIAQNKTYGYEIEGKVAKEKLAGFDVKMNLSLRYKEPKVLDKLMNAAAAVQIFDLVKVDYIVKDHEAVQERLITEAARVIKNKAARHEKLFGIKLAQPQVHVERTRIYYPTEMYDS